MIIITVVVAIIIIVFLTFSKLEKQELEEQNNHPRIIEQKKEALRKEREEMEIRNSGVKLSFDSKKDCTNNLIKTKGFYVTKTENPNGYMFLYFRQDGYVLKEFKEKLLNTEAVNDSKKYMEKIHNVLHKLNDSNLSMDFGKYRMDDNKIHIEFSFIDDTHNPYENRQQKSTITMNGRIIYINLELRAFSKVYKSALKKFEERTIFESASFSYRE